MNGGAHGDVDEELLERPAVHQRPGLCSMRRQMLLLGALVVISAVLGGLAAALMVGGERQPPPAPPRPAIIPDTPAADPCRYAPLAWPCSSSLGAVFH